MAYVLLKRGECAARQLTTRGDSIAGVVGLGGPVLSS
jgi:hypothetical protein